MAEEIAQLPSQKQLGWLCDYFRVLPTDPKVQALTSEQIHDLWLQLERLHPDQFKRSGVWYDDDYEREEEEAIAEGEGILWEDTEVVEQSARLEPATVVLSNTPVVNADEWEDVRF